MPWTPVLTHTAGTQTYWDSQTKEIATTEVQQAESTLACWDCTFRYARTTPSGTREDDMTFGLRIAKQIGGNMWGVGLLSELATIETTLNTMVASLAAVQAPTITLAEYIWHLRRADHPPAEGGGEKVGPAIRKTAKSVVGTGTGGRNADQVAMSVTFETASRKHWGRFYLPGVSNSQIDTTYGRFTSAACDAVALAVRTAINSLSLAGYEVGVWSYPKKAFLTVWQLQVDNVVDIQRRRRAKQKSYARLYTS